MSTDVELRAARPDETAYVETLLAESGLPVADVPDALDTLLVCEDGNGGRVGVGGLQRCGDASLALLRSVAVEEAARGNGYGTALCEGLLERVPADVTAVYR